MRADEIPACPFAARNASARRQPAMIDRPRDALQRSVGQFSGDARPLRIAFNNACRCDRSETRFEAKNGGRSEAKQHESLRGQVRQRMANVVVVTR